MITLTAKMRIQGEIPLSAEIGESELGGGALIGETVDVEAVFDRRNLLSLEGQVAEREDAEFPSWGVFSSGGRLSFKDNGSLFLGYANAGLLKGGIQIQLVLSDKIQGTTETVGVYQTTNWNYDNNDKVVEVQFDDGLTQMQDVEVQFPTYSAISMQEFYDFLVSNTIQLGFDFEPLGEREIQVLGMECKRPRNKKASLWSQWNKLCSVCRFVVFRNESGKVETRFVEV